MFERFVQCCVKNHGAAEKLSRFATVSRPPGRGAVATVTAQTGARQKQKFVAGPECRRLRFFLQGRKKMPAQSPQSAPPDPLNGTCSRAVRWPQTSQCRCCDLPPIVHLLRGGFGLPIFYCSRFAGGDLPSTCASPFHAPTVPTRQRLIPFSTVPELLRNAETLPSWDALPPGRTEPGPS